MTKPRSLRPSLSPATANAWRRWLEDHHASSSGVWLAVHKKNATPGLLRYEEAVEEALCFGWIDGQLRPLDSTRFRIWFSPRKPNSLWAESNKRRVRKLIREGRMREPGLAKVRQAQRNGQWRSATARERTDRIPPAIQRALARRKGALAQFRGLSPSRRKMILYWIGSARKDETARSRIEKMVEYLMGDRSRLPWEVPKARSSGKGARSGRDH
jgi:uncharacterized protein YdeI (YjbR/CyaY-like superfamily)